MDGKRSGKGLANTLRFTGGTALRLGCKPKPTPRVDVTSAELAKALSKSLDKQAAAVKAAASTKTKSNGGTLRSPIAPSASAGGILTPYERDKSRDSSQPSRRIPISPRELTYLSTWPYGSKRAAPQPAAD